MPDEPEKSGQEPNLELPPLLGFGRKKKKRETGTVADQPAPDEAVAEEPAPDEAAAEEPAPDEAVAEEPAPAERAADSDDPLAADPVPQARAGLAPATNRPKRPPPVPPPAATRPQPAVEPEVRREAKPEPPPVPEVTKEPEVRSEPEVQAEPEVQPELEVRPEPEVKAEPDAVPDSVSQPEARRGPEFTYEPEASATDDTEVYENVPPPEPVAVPAAEPANEPVAAGGGPRVPPSDAPVHEGNVGWADEEPVHEPVDEPVDEPVGATRRERLPRRQLPVINARLAAGITGGIVGLLGVALTSLAGRGCEVIRGVGSCGGIGLLALLVILALEVLLGAVLLKAWRLSDPTSTSFLGVGLAAVFVLLFLLSSLESVWMFLVIPLLTVLTFVVSWMVTETFVEPSLDDLHR